MSLRSLISLAHSADWHRNSTLRRLVFAVLTRAGDRDIKISHHWVAGARLRLNILRHRGYWYHARRREWGVMTSLPKVIRKADTVIEVGAHIGYISMYIADLVGRNGKVFAFEPSKDNLEYLNANTAPCKQLEVIPLAVSDRASTAKFYVEDLSGQNSTLVKDYANLSENSRNAYTSADYRVTTVETTTLDQFVASRELKPDFIKIDIEGAEAIALKGMKDCLLRHRPKLMIEVTEQEDEVMREMARAGYLAYDSRLNTFGPAADQGPNRFFIPIEQAQRFSQREQS